MSTDDAVRASFHAQATACDTLGSPFTARLCRLLGDRLDRTSETGRRILDWRGEPSSRGDAVALRLCGALHALVLTGSDQALAVVYPPHHHAIAEDTLWQAVAAAIARHDASIVERLAFAPQTNEVRRSAALMPALMALTRRFEMPLVLSEVGASAGLNLLMDAFRFTLGETHAGPAESGVHIAPEWRGAPVAAAEITVGERRGCDLNPLDARAPEDRLRLTSYLWADQAERIERTKAAFAIAARHPTLVDRMDAVDWLRDRLAEPRPGTVHVVYHTIAWQYLPAHAQAEGNALIAASGAKASAAAPLVRIQMEADDKGPGAAILMQTWPGDGERLVGRADFHGRWIDWYGL